MDTILAAFLTISMCCFRTGTVIINIKRSAIRFGYAFFIVVSIHKVLFPESQNTLFVTCMVKLVR